MRGRKADLSQRAQELCATVALQGAAPWASCGDGLGRAGGSRSPCYGRPGAGGWLSVPALWTAWGGRVALGPRVVLHGTNSAFVSPRARQEVLRAAA